MPETKTFRIDLERRFHDAKVTAPGQGDPIYGLGILDKVDRYAYSLFGDLAGKTVLEIGCGTGENAVKLAAEGARVFAIDISTEMVRKTIQRSQQKSLDNQITVLEMNAEQMAFADDAFDMVFGHSVLHHTDLGLTRGEAYRILKTGGIGVFVEPLGHNPLVNLFRRLTPHRRTPTEQPLTWEDLLFLGQPFSSFTHREFYLIALAAFVLLPFGNRRLFQSAVKILSHVDDVIFQIFPWLRRYAWVTVIRVVK